MPKDISVNTKSRNGVMLSDSKPLHEPMESVSAFILRSWYTACNEISRSRQGNGTKPNPY